MTLREAIAAATACLTQEPALQADATRDAELLLLHTLTVPRTVLFTDPDRQLTDPQRAAFELAIGRRLAREPIQYITGVQEFYGLPLRVTPAVLIPRPETELLVEGVLARLSGDLPLQLVDIGTGSGAIAIALAAHLPMAEITAVDLSPAALDVARENAATLGFGGRIRFVEADLLAALDPHQLFDAIVSNPPYIPELDRATLHPQVRDYEPITALFAGHDGLDIYRRLIPQAFAALKPGGLLALEIGHGQRAAIAALLSGWDEIEFLEDLQRIPRVALARRG